MLFRSIGSVLQYCGPRLVHPRTPRELVKRYLREVRFITANRSQRNRKRVVCFLTTQDYILLTADMHEKFSMRALGVRIPPDEEK